MSLRLWIAALVLIVMLIAGYCLYALFSSPKSIHLDQQVYIWQRVWTTQHQTALKQSHALFSAMRVLVLQIHPQEGIRTIAVNTALLKQDGRPVWLVVRLDGQLPHLNQPLIIKQVQRTINAWSKAGIRLTGIEIDYDAPTAKLAAYQQFVHALRKTLPKELTLSITALPTWLESPLLPTLLQTADTSVLQVHNVQSPEKGLIDSPLAQRWLHEYAGKTRHPFFIALPAYGSALTRDNRVESEIPLSYAEELQELSVAPQTLADFIQQLEDTPPKGLQGIVWFRLPLASDRRAWSMTTLEAVIHHQSLAPRLSVIITPTQDAKLFDLAIKNSGHIDSPLPQQIALQNAKCEFTDGTNHYRSELTQDALLFTRISSQQLRAGENSPLGWARCAKTLQGNFDVKP